ncbi:LuxR C-terminal-related transcriptional regulator [Ktedonospora formicarum]|uniref:LuxR family transcriptional regulator n=1 Tax=Ktedonospora formicarum TaxID=2778364 RepID=A0A8J3HX66_9CHLR|nr:LuxR C-terminal-related transcriptional regulator [Ktedonospora formicarum]GHO42307.1 LuxR family transcriptional regulator [Ktedonospora formicarum]
MPRYAHTQLRWSDEAQTYVLFIDDQESNQTLTSDWLEQNSSFSFHSRWGERYTVRKQKVQRGSSYWYAYQRQHGHVVKRYLGKATDITFSRLEEVTRLLESGDEAEEDTLLSAHPREQLQSAPDISGAEARQSSAHTEISQILLTKLSPPRLPGFLLDRSHLFTLLDEGRAGSLTLLSAPAGFGKTTLVRQWMAAHRSHLDFPPVAWVSLETADNDPLRFWRYLVTACQMFQVDLQATYAALQVLTPQPPFVSTSLEIMLTALLNALAQCPSQGILVLEDYHHITAREIQDSFSFFLAHLPSTLHLILISRSDPPFSLARLRAQSLIYEIRAVDLRFSQEETAILLHHTLPFELSSSTIQHLHAQLQGWGAGLHLLKHILQRSTSLEEERQATALISRSHTPLQEYFVTEVLALQPEPVQQFVLQTSLLTYLTASLCDAVTEQQNSQEILAQLERINLFLEPLDAATPDLLQASPQWYRYHTLFAEAMRNEAHRQFKEDYLRRLSLRASQWYETHGFLQEAIEVALSAQEYNRAAILIARSIEERTFPGEIHEPYTLRRWLEQLPEATLEQNPVLCLSYAITLLFQSTSWQPDPLTLPLIERLLNTAEHGFREESQLSKLGELFALRSLLALRKGDMQAAARDAEQALSWLVQTQQALWRGLSLCIIGEKWNQMGRFKQARNALLEASTLCETVHNHFFKHVALVMLAQVCFELGDIQTASTLFRQALAQTWAYEQFQMLTHWRCVALIGLATLYYECNELENAYQHIQDAIVISQSHHLLHHETRATLLLNRVQQAQNQHLNAQQTLSALLEKIPVSLSQHARAIQAAQAQLALSTGDQITIQRWATDHLSHHDLSQEREEELLVIRWLRTQGKQKEASLQLENLLAIAQEKEFTRYILELQVERILIEASRKHKSEAQQLLLQVLMQAFDRNAMRLFLNAGEQMAVLLRSILPQVHDQPLQAFIRTLLHAFPTQQQDGPQAQTAFLVDPLSPQEMRVLRLLVQHHSNTYIANELTVSVNTVRTQVQSIFSKLGVHTRSAASEMARDLHLIS